jgi:hypothetical protein
LRGWCADSAFSAARCRRGGWYAQCCGEKLCAPRTGRWL